jgi:hypothetical protein
MPAPPLRGLDCGAFWAGRWCPGDLPVPDPRTAATTIRFGDKLGHVAAYASLMGWWLQIDRRPERLALLFVLMGLALEILQSLGGYRNGDIFDMAANTLGVGLGWLSALLLPDWLARLDRLARSPGRMSGVLASERGRAARAVLAERDVDLKLAGAEKALVRMASRRRLQLEMDGGPILDTPGLPDKPPLASPKAMPRRELNGPETTPPSSTPWPTSNSTPSTWPWTRCSASPACPRRSTATGCTWRRKRPITSACCGTTCAAWAGTTATFPPTPASGKWRRRPPTTPSPAWPWCRACLEARGLDVTPDIQRKLRGYGDRAGADILDIILRDEIGHVAAGDRWFRHLCAERGLEPEAAYRDCSPCPACPGHGGPSTSPPAWPPASASRKWLAKLAEPTVNLNPDMCLSPCPGGGGGA